MFEPLQIDRVSIRGRVAFAISCLENVCGQLGIESAAMRSRVDLFWTYTSARRLDQWESDAADALPDEEDVEAHAERFGYAHLDRQDREFVTEVVQAVFEIGTNNLYAGFSSSSTQVPTYAVARMLDSRGYPVPDIKRFWLSSVEEFHGWGDPIERSAFRPE